MAELLLLRIQLSSDRVVVSNDLEISFRCTVRVPDNKQVSYLPPNLGAFPLTPVSQHANKMHPGMSAKGGLFFPMYRKFHR